MLLLMFRCTGCRSTHLGCVSVPKDAVWLPLESPIAQPRLQTPKYLENLSAALVPEKGQMRGCYRQEKKIILFSLIPRGYSCPRNVGLGEDKVRDSGRSELQLGAADKPEPGSASVVRSFGRC